jgi:DNA-binding response OmpR family regulator
VIFMTSAVLLVETDEPFATEACAALAAAGFDTVCATGPLRALDELDARVFALLITRIRFARGEPHGFALARMARHRRGPAQVIFLAEAGEDLGPEGVEPFSVLRKPLSTATLVGEARAALGRAAW